MKHSPLGTLRGALSALAVTSLTTTCLALTVSPASAAELPASNLDAHLFQVGASGTAAGISMYDSAENYRYAGNADQARSSASANFYSYDPGDGGPRIWYGGSNASAIGAGVGFADAGEKLSSQAAASAFATRTQPLAEKSAPGGYSAPQGLGTVLANTARTTSSTADVNQADFGPAEAELGAATASSDGVDLGDLTMGSTTLDPVTTIGGTSVTTARTRWVDIADSERRGVGASATGGTGTWRLLNDTVTVEVLTRPRCR